MSDIPPAVRAAVVARDEGTCRVCGTWVGDEGALHHIEYRSQGGQHTVENLVTVHWMYAPRCHERVHSQKALWQPILLETVKHDGMNAMQLRRWHDAAVAANFRSRR